MKVSVETTINAPPHVVFERVMDIANWEKAISAIEKIEILTKGPIGVGTKFRETRTMFGHQASEDMTIAQIEPSQKLVLTAHSHGMYYKTEHLFEDVDGATRISLVFEGKPETLTARLMTPISWIMCRSMQKMISADLNDLRSHIEGSP